MSDIHRLQDDTTNSMPDDLTLLRSCRLMLYEWRGTRISQGITTPHKELEELIRQLDKRVNEPTNTIEDSYNARWFWDD
jgi:hypothetical protein